MIGTQDLLSEDDATEMNMRGCGKALDDMWWDRRMDGFGILVFQHGRSRLEDCVVIILGVVVASMPVKPLDIAHGDRFVCGNAPTKH